MQVQRIRNDNRKKYEGTVEVFDKSGKCKSSSSIDFLEQNKDNTIEKMHEVLEGVPLKRGEKVIIMINGIGQIQHWISQDGALNRGKLVTDLVKKRITQCSKCEQISPNPDAKFCVFCGSKLRY